MQQNEVNSVITFTCLDTNNTQVDDSNMPSILKIDTARSEPFLLSPTSILKKHELHHTNTSPTLSERRPSLVKFSFDPELIHQSSEDIFYDACSYISSSEKRLSLKKSFSKSRPSYTSNVSSAKTTSISIHYNTDQPDIKQGIVLCCMIKKKTNRRYPIKWKEYYAVISSSNTLQLYPICYCNEKHFVHVVFHKHNSYYKRPKNELDSSFHLSLVSPIDFVWSLESDSHLYYFQTNSISTSQSWYQAMYTALPITSKKPIPSSVDVFVPQLGLSIQLPLTMKGDEHVDMRKVRDSALALLSRHGNTHWNKRSVGLCWKYHDTVDWVVHPDRITQPANLIEPRLIEKMHELELWHEPQINKVSEKRGPLVSGYLLCATSLRFYYASLIDQYLFLYQVSQPERNRHLLDCCSEGIFKRHPTVPQDVIGDLVQVIDLLKIKEFNDHALFINDSMRFEASTDVNFIKTLIHHIKEFKEKKSIKQVDVVYVKSNVHQFEKRLCLLTETGEFYSLIPQRHLQPVYILDFHISLVNNDRMYMLSGDELCHHIPGLPTEQVPSMIFENGMITQDTKPNQCCFIMYHQSKSYVFLTRSKLEKESWLQTICCFLT